MNKFSSPENQGYLKHNLKTFPGKIIMYKCPICALWPSSHSLVKMGEKDEIVYYTCPSQATMYYDVKGIIHHYDGVLSEIPENKEWIWIFDSKGFGFRHAMQINVAIELARLISNKFSKNLNKVIIINPTFYITMIHKIITPFLNQKLKDCIEINYDITEFIV